MLNKFQSSTGASAWTFKFLSTFTVTFLVCFLVFLLAYRYPNIPIISIECAVYGFLMALCRALDKEPRLNIYDVQKFIYTNLIFLLLTSYFFIIELPINAKYAIFWAFAYSSLASGFQIFINRSLTKSKFKLLLSPFIVSGLSSVPLILAEVSYIFDLSQQGYEMGVGISQLVLFLPPMIAICSAFIIYLESNSFFARKK